MGPWPCLRERVRRIADSCDTGCGAGMTQKDIECGEQSESGWSVALLPSASFRFVCRTGRRRRARPLGRRRAKRARNASAAAAPSTHPPRSRAAPPRWRRTRRRTRQVSDGDAPRRRRAPGRPGPRSAPDPVGVSVLGYRSQVRRSGRAAARRPAPSARPSPAASDRGDPGPWWPTLGRASPSGIRRSGICSAATSAHVLTDRAPDRPRDRTRASRAGPARPRPPYPYDSPAARSSSAMSRPTAHRRAHTPFPAVAERDERRGEPRMPDIARQSGRAARRPCPPQQLRAGRARAARRAPSRCAPRCARARRATPRSPATVMGGTLGRRAARPWVRLTKFVPDPAAWPTSAAQAGWSGDPLREPDAHRPRPRWVDADIRPQDDLFGHVNGRWLTHARDPRRPRAGAVRAAGRRAPRSRSARSSRTPARRRTGPPTPTRKIAGLYASFMDAERDRGARRRAAAAAARRGRRRRATCATSRRSSGEFERIGGRGAVRLVRRHRRARTPTATSSTSSRAGSACPDESYYRDEKFAEIREKYVAYLTRLLELVGLPDPPAAADQVMALETGAGRGVTGSAPSTRDVAEDLQPA